MPRRNGDPGLDAQGRQARNRRYVAGILIGMRKIGAFLLFIVAGALLMLAWFAIASLWSENAEESDSLYLSIAVIEIAVALGFAGLGGWMLRGR